jgi:hypothetical protein
VLCERRRAIWRLSLWDDAINTGYNFAFVRVYTCGGSTDSGSITSYNSLRAAGMSHVSEIGIARVNLAAQRVIALFSRCNFTFVSFNGCVFTYTRFCRW